MPESKLIKPHGSDSLKILLLSGKEKEEELKKASKLKRINMTSRETGDLIMLGIGGFTPLEGFMRHDDWKGVCSEMKMTNGLFWPIPITLSVSDEVAKSLSANEEVTLVSSETKEVMGTMKVTEKYQVDKKFECIYNRRPGTSWCKNGYGTVRLEHCWSCKSTF
jgi:sulfate adenylyltransferase